MTIPWAPGHQIGIYVQLSGSVPALVATARSADDVPPLLRHIAAEWQRKRFIEVDNAAYFATCEETDSTD